MRTFVLACVLLASLAGRADAVASQEADTWAGQISAVAQTVSCDNLRVGGPLCSGQYGMQDIYDSLDLSTPMTVEMAEFADGLANIATEFFSSKGDLVKDLKAAAETAFRGATDSNSESVSSLSGFLSMTESSPWTEADTVAGQFFFDGQRINTQSSGYRLPAGTEVDDTVLDSVARGARLDETFRGLLQSQDERDWNLMFFGDSRTGTFTQFPGQEWARDGSGYRNYDPRERPWYVAASSGPKDVLLVIDTSGSMAEGAPSSRLSLAKDAAKAVLSSLTPNDYVNVVEFSSDASLPRCPLGSDDDAGLTSQLVRATPANVAKLTSFVDGMRPSGGTNYEAAMRTAYDLLAATAEAKSGSGCQASILFLSDGDIAEGLKGDDFLNLVRQLNDKPDQSARIFSYTLGDGITNQEVPLQMACITEGVYSHIPDGGNLRGAMAGFYNVYARGLSDTSTPAYTPPYLFTTGGAPIMGLTSMMPVFDSDANRFIGVVGVDMELQALLQTLAAHRPSDNSYVFMVNNEGETLVHPALDDESEEANFPDISQLEGADFAASSIRSKLLNQQAGSTVLQNVQKVVPVGSGGGVRAETVTKSYYYRPITGTTFSVCLVIEQGPSSGDTFQFSQQGSTSVSCESAGSAPGCASSADNGTACTTPCLPATAAYHRLDLVPGNIPDSTIAPWTGTKVDLSVSAFKLAASLLRSPSSYLRDQETVAQVTELNSRAYTGSLLQALTDGNPTFTLPGGGVTPSVLQSVTAELRKTAAIEPVWKQTRDSSTVARYIGTRNGFFRTYPAHVITLDDDPRRYDPTLRPWFYRALANKASFTFSTPYEDASTGDLYITLAVTVATGESGRTTLTPTAEVSAVMGLDWQYSIFEGLIESSAASNGISCGSSDIYCMLLDSSGYVINHQLYTQSNFNPDDRWVGVLEPQFADYLVDAGFLVAEPEPFVNYLTNQLDYYYTTDVSQLPLASTPSTRYANSDWKVVAIEDTNLFLVTFDDWDGVTTNAISCRYGVPHVTCPNLALPRSVDNDVDACDIQPEEGRVAPSCPSIALSGDALEELRGEQTCGTGGLGSDAVMIGLLAAGGVVFVGFIVWFTMCRNRGEGKHSSRGAAHVPRAVSSAPPADPEGGVELPPAYAA